MSETTRIVRGTRNPYKIVDHTRERRKGIIASSLQELTDVARSKLDLPSDAVLTIVLEQDGTIVDDEEYFTLLEKNTNLMILHSDQKWKAISDYLSVDNVDTIECSSMESGDVLERDRPSIESLVLLLHRDPSLISLLEDYDLKLLSDMNINSLAVVPDRLFLNQLKEASGRFLAKNRDKRGSMALLRMY